MTMVLILVVPSFALNVAIADFEENASYDISFGLPELFKHEVTEFLVLLKTRGLRCTSPMKYLDL